MDTLAQGNVISQIHVEKKKQSIKEAVLKPSGVSEADASTFLGISRSALRKSRMNGTQEGHIPPVPFVRAGRRIIYLVDDLNSWLQQLRVSFADEQSGGTSILPTTQTGSPEAPNHG